VDDSRRYDDLSDEQLRCVDAVCETFEERLRSATPVTIESQLDGILAVIESAVFRELLAIELERRFADLQEPDLAEYHARFPSHYE
jgi:hypothetical protein